MQRFGIDQFDPHIIRDLRVGLLAHPASVNAEGVHTADVLRSAGINLVAVFGPEHGYFGWGGAGEKILDTTHPFYDVPVHSLYGEQRKPSHAMLEGVDALVIDLQDLGARCYTYLSTMRYVLEVAAELGIFVHVLDRPIPLPMIFDGPRLKRGFESFVCLVDVPLCFSMTPGEAAAYMNEKFGLKAKLAITPCGPGTEFEIRVAPSPAIRSAATARAYLATVWTEALPQFKCDRHGLIPFQCLASDWLEPERLIDAMPRIPGVKLFPHLLREDGEIYKGIRIAASPTSLRPVKLGVQLLAALRDVYGNDKIWGGEDVKPEFFDKLMGTDEVRRSLLNGESAESIATQWQPGIDAFENEWESVRFE